jgi:hypothetical protein
MKREDVNGRNDKKEGEERFFGPLAMASWSLERTMDAQGTPPDDLSWSCCCFCSSAESIRAPTKHSSVTFASLGRDPSAIPRTVAAISGINKQRQQEQRYNSNCASLSLAFRRKSKETDKQGAEEGWG